jgi:hypothetical protein
MLMLVAIVKKPTQKEREDGSGKEELVMEPKFLLADSEIGAAMQVAMDHKDEISKVDQSRLDVQVYSFGQAPA